MDNSEIVYRYGKIAAVASIVLAIGTVFYHYVEDFSWLDAAYFSVVSLATVGYGDLAPQTAAGKIFTMVYILFGVGIFTAFVSATLRHQQIRMQTNRERREAEREKFREH